MDYEKLLNQLHVTNKEFESIEITNNAFLDYVKNTNIRDKIENTEFLLKDKNFLVVKSFKYEAKATYRFVRDENKNFVAEYVFYVQTDDENEKIEVFRFYLTKNGNIIKSFEADNIIGNFHTTYNTYGCNDPHVANCIYCEVLNGILHSSLFAPSNAIKD